jgi:hypothetical protein
MNLTTTARGYSVSFRSSLEDKVLFMAETLKKEVLEGNHQIKKIRQLKKLFRKFAVVLGVRVGMATKALAATTATATATTITPAVILHWGIMLALVTVSIGVAISMSMLAVAGIYRMFKRRDEATEWTTDIVKGLVQVLVAVPIVYVVFTIAQHMFKALPALSGLAF